MTCSKCNNDLTKQDSVIRKYFKRGFYDPNGFFSETSSLGIEADMCAQCGKVVFEP
ncbi:MAG: hypothetical protein HZB80_01945 [Deltaproteobacteria bacterium]|nr:hypothetical protein [Deltaproteobacteria bacterium]